MTTSLQGKSLFDRTLAEHELLSRNAQAAVVSRRADIDQLERITVALNARGLLARAAVTTHQLGSGAYVRLRLRSSGTAAQLADALEWLMADGVRVDRVSPAAATMRKYRLGLRLMDVEFDAYVHAPEKVARLQQLAEAA